MACAVAAPDTEAAGDQQVVGRVDVAAQPRPRAGQLDGSRMSMALSRIRPEMRIESDAEGKQRRRARAVPVADEAARVAAGRSDRLGQLLRLQRRQIALQRNDIRCLHADRGFGGGDRVVQRIAMTLGGRIDQHPGTQSPGGVGGNLIGGDDGDRLQGGNGRRGGDGVDEHGQHHAFPGGGRENRCQPGLGGGEPLHGDHQPDICGVACPACRS